MTGKRLEPRTSLSVPVRIWGVDAAGKPFVETVFTGDISAAGARLQGVHASLARGGTIAVRNANAQAHYRVAWVGEHGTPRQGQIGIFCVEPGKNIWGVELPQSMADTFDATLRSDAAAMEPNAADAAYARAVSARVQKISAEMRELEQVLRAGLVDARILREFRDVVDQMRHTGWAVQQYVDMRAQNADSAGILPLLASERMRVALKLTQQLHGDLASGFIPKEAAGAAELCDALEALARVLRAP